MKINEKYLIFHDLIGYDVQIKSKFRSTNQVFLDSGMIIDETKNIITTKKDDKIKKYIKKDNIFKIITLETEKNNNNEKFELEVDGDRIIGRPENRLRNLKKKNG